MSYTHEVIDSDGSKGKCSITHYPDICPVCNSGGQPTFVVSTSHHYPQQGYLIYAVYRCPISKCRALYIALYQANSHNGVFQTSQKLTAPFQIKATASFPENIQQVSKNFCEIYEQAQIAEDNGLNQIIGPAYRKSLEFLIKDFVIRQKYPADEANQGTVRNTFLGKVIDDHIDEAVIKQCAKRATWLGNDETHYIRKWENKDINDLKALIKITVSFIDMSIEAARYLKEMPDGNGAKAPAPKAPEALPPPEKMNQLAPPAPQHNP